MSVLQKLFDGASNQFVIASEIWIPGHLPGYKLATLILAAGSNVEPGGKKKNIFITPASRIVFLFI